MVVVERLPAADAATRPVPDDLPGGVQRPAHEISVLASEPVRDHEAADAAEHERDHRDHVASLSLSCTPDPRWCAGSGRTAPSTSSRARPGTAGRSTPSGHLSPCSWTPTTRPMSRLDPGGAVVVARVLRWVAAGCALVAVVLLALILVGLPPDGWLPG